MQRRNAFTMMEVLLAFAIVTSSLYVASSLQLKNLLALAREQTLLARTLLLKNYTYTLLTEWHHSQGDVTRKDTNDEYVRSLHALPIEPHSTLAGQTTMVQHVTATVTWTQFYVKRTENLVSYIVVPKGKE